jgi:hypothetical protein
MTRRQVTHTRKDPEGDIETLCNPGAVWSPRPKPSAIADIEGGIHQYFVGGRGEEVDIHVIDGPTGKYLRTDPDRTNSNNLDLLPDC